MSRIVWLPRAALMLLIVSVSINVLQARRITSFVNPKSPPVAPLGARATPIDGTSVAGEPVRLTFDHGTPTVLYFFSSRCAWCEKNWTNVRSLARAAGERFRFVAVTTEVDVRDFVEMRSLDLEVIQGISEQALQAFRFGGTPHTVVVSSQGVIAREWLGAFSGPVQRQVEEFFGIRLPGLKR
jgi:thioredoxin-related protein